MTPSLITYPYGNIVPFRNSAVWKKKTDRIVSLFTCPFRDRIACGLVKDEAVAEVEKRQDGVYRFTYPSGERIACGLVKGEAVAEVKRRHVGVYRLTCPSGEGTACDLFKDEAVTEVDQKKTGWCLRLRTILITGLCAALLKVKLSLK